MHSTFKDSAVIQEKHILQMPSLSLLRARVRVASQPQVSLLTLLGQWMGPQLKTREVPSFTNLLFSRPCSEKVPRQDCHAEDKTEKMKVWQEGQQRRRTVEQSMCPGAKDDSHQRIRNGKALPSNAAGTRNCDSSALLGLPTTSISSPPMSQVLAVAKCWPQPRHCTEVSLSMSLIGFVVLKSVH